jgi:hypothetical protein
VAEDHTSASDRLIVGMGHHDQKAPFRVHR